MGLGGKLSGEGKTAKQIGLTSSHNYHRDLRHAIFYRERETWLIFCQINSDYIMTMYSPFGASVQHFLLTDMMVRNSWSTIYPPEALVV